MSLTQTEWIAYLSVAVSICLVVTLCLVATLILFNAKFKKHQQAQKQVNQKLAQELDSLRVQLEMVNKGTIGMGRRLMTTEKRLNQTMERQDTMESKGSEQLSFKQAARLFERGLEMDNVIEKVGITRSEAKLLDMFQQKQAESLED
ncbi:MAG: DUF2802 domain-containing protein [Pseudomonadales bacterium]|nr:DUF2802 domain-containing protein [Pseudomonadales bacterium]